MSDLFHELQDTIGRIKGNIRLRSMDEASTKQAIILPILSKLSWDIWNIEEVSPEYTVENKRVDYSLRLFGKNHLFLEVKKTSEPLDIHEEQLLNYSFRQGVKLSCLTNGITWMFYLPLKEGDWAARRFYTIDIDEQDIEDVTNKFFEILSRDNIKNGSAYSNAEIIYSGAVKKRTLEDSIPAAWNKILEEKSPPLIDLLTDTTEKLCGFRPSDSDIFIFLSSNRRSFEVKPIIVDRTNYQSPRSTETPRKNRDIGIPEETAIHLKTNHSIALELLRSVDHSTMRDAIGEKWITNNKGGVRAQSVCWLFCWGKTGMKSKDTARKTEKIFDQILDISFNEFDQHIDLDIARKMRSKTGNIEASLAKLIGRKLISRLTS